ncbi:MAG: hypothetical protein AAF950_03490 [Pseudomonadota bacterium]
MVDTTSPTSNGLRHASLHRGQMVRLTVVGFATWFGVAFLLQYAGSIGAYQGSGRVLMYALIVLGTPALLLALMPLAGIARNQIVLGAAWVVGIASVCDGLALAWFPSLYGGSPFMVAGAGSTLLWGVGFACLLSFFINQEPKS